MKHLRLIFAIAVLVLVAAAQIPPDLGDIDMTPPPFEDKASLFEQDESVPEEHRVIKLTGELYDELITSRWGTPLNGDTPWVILFVLPDQVDNRRAMTNYK